MEKISNRISTYIGNGRILTQDAWGHKLILNSSDLSLTPHIIIDGHWEKWITDIFISLLKAGMSVIDVGANIGYYSVLAATAIGPSGKLYSFEANPSTFELLSANIEINGLKGNSNLVQKAVADSTKERKFYALRDHQGSSSLYKNLLTSNSFTNDYINEVKVQSITLDDHIPKDVSINLLKIDVEGAELEVLNGAVRVVESSPDLIIIMEWCPRMLSHKTSNAIDVFNFLTNHGMRLFIINHSSKIEQASLDKLLEIDHCDILATRVRQL